MSVNDLEIEYDSVGKGKGVTALKGLTFTAPQKRFVSIVGPSGCGKSTLLKTVLGLIRPKSGKILVDGSEVHGPGYERAMVFQEFGLLYWRNVEKNIEFGLELRGVPKAERRAKAAKLIELVGLKGFEKSLPNQLSGGMKQRVGIARALVVEPKVLLMDEPFANVDVQTKVLLQDEITRIWNSSPTTVLFVTHDIEEAVYLGDIVYVLTGRPGKVKERIDVEIPRPRRYEVRTSKEFGELRQHIWNSIMEEFRPN